MLKSKSILEVKIGERTYELLCPQDSPLGEVHDSICQMKKYIIDRMVDVQKAEQEAAEKAKQEVEVEIIK